MADTPVFSTETLTKAFLAGLVGGLLGTAAKVVAEKLLPPRTSEQVTPPELIVEHVAAAADVHLSPEAEKTLSQGGHWAFGTLTGGAYGVVAEYQPRATAWRGAVFGLTLNRLTHQGVLPQAGLIEPVEDQPAQERLSEWVTHVVYGAVTESVRRIVRKHL